MKHDISVATLIHHCRALANEMAMENADEQAAHVMNAILDLKKSFSPEYQAELDRMDLERLERLRAS